MSETSDFYAEIAEAAQELIDGFGGPGLIRRNGVSTYDPSTGATSAPAPQDFPVNAAVFDFAAKLVDGTLIQQGDKQVFLGATNLDTPKTTDLFLFPSPINTPYTIVTVKPLAPAGINVLYELQVRSA